MGAHSKRKGSAGEREFANLLRIEGWASARRGCQFAGHDEEGKEFPDVVCSELPYIHWEVKRTKKQTNIGDAICQAMRDAQDDQVPVVAHRKDHYPWMVTLTFEQFAKFLRGDFPPESKTNPEPKEKNT
jgi:Holliday junction resolvase